MAARVTRDYRPCLRSFSLPVCEFTNTLLVGLAQDGSVVSVLGTRHAGFTYATTASAGTRTDGGDTRQIKYGTMASPAMRLEGPQMFLPRNFSRNEQRIFCRPTMTQTAAAGYRKCQVYVLSTLELLNVLSFGHSIVSNKLHPTVQVLSAFVFSGSTC